MMTPLCCGAKDIFCSLFQLESELNYSVTQLTNVACSHIRILLDHTNSP